MTDFRTSEGSTMREGKQEQELQQGHRLCKKSDPSTVWLYVGSVEWRGDTFYIGALEQAPRTLNILAPQQLEDAPREPPHHHVAEIIRGRVHIVAPELVKNGDYLYLKKDA